MTTHADPRGTHRDRWVHAKPTIGRGIPVDYEAVATLMRRVGIQGLPDNRHRRRKAPSTPTVSDLVDRSIDRRVSDQLWITDITEHRTREGELYCCVVLDTFSQRVVGWSIDSIQTSTLVTNALGMANSFADLCKVLGADIDAVTTGLGRDHRIGPHFLQPGPGFGGSCFPKDARALLDLGAGHGLDVPILAAAVKVNAQRQERMAEMVLAEMVGADEPVVALWGLAFKAGTDDTRESPALNIGESLARRGVVVRAYDPEATAGEPITLCDSALDAATGADVLVVATEWPEFTEVDPVQIASTMRGDLVVDLRNLLDTEQIRAAGLRIRGVGKPSS